jgi:proteasome lid subunit RPN8/RPN11
MIPESIIEVVRRHAAAMSPQECCGLIIVHKGKLRYRPCKNIHIEPRRAFRIDERDWAAAEDLGEISYIVHSHPFESAQPTDVDKVQIEEHGKPWLIVNHPVGSWTVTEPSGYEAPFIGRQFCYGVLDCGILVKDYYKRRLGIDLAYYRAEDHWWDRGEKVIEDHFEDIGFVKVLDGPVLHDVIGMMIDGEVAAKTTNHLGIFLGSNLMLHHLRDRLSSRDIYGGWYRKCTSIILRHKTLL